MRQALDRISELVTESDRLKDQANAAWLSASRIVVEHRGLTLSTDTRIVVEKEEASLHLYLQLPDREPHEEEVQCGVVKEEPVLVE